MSQVRRVASNAAFLIIADVASLLLGFLVAVSIARYLGTEGYGTISFALALTAITGLFTDLGMQSLMVREIARDKSLTRKYAANVAVLKVLLIVLALGLTAATINIMDKPQQTVLVVYLIGLALVFNAYNTMLYAIFRAHERMEFVALGQVLGWAMTLGAVLFAINREYSITAVALAYVIGAAATLAALSSIAVWKLMTPRVEVDLGFWKTILRQAWPFALATVFLTVYYWVDSVMLSIMKGEEEVGLYNVAYRLMLTLQFIPQAYFGAIFPVMSRMHASSAPSLTFILERSLKYMFIISVPIALGTTLLAERIVVEVFDPEYVGATRALQILIWTLVVTFGSSAFAVLFNSVNRQNIVAMFTGITVLANITLNLVLIPGYGLVGASIATLVTSSLALLMAFLFSFKLGYAISIRAFAVSAFKVLAAAALMAVFVRYFDGFNLLILVPLSALVYFAVILALRGLDREDMNLVRSVVAGKQS